MTAMRQNTNLASSQSSSLSCECLEPQRLRLNILDAQLQEEVKAAICNQIKWDHLLIKDTLSV